MKVYIVDTNKKITNENFFAFPELFKIEATKQKNVYTLKEFENIFNSYKLDNRSLLIRFF